jgi:CDP-diacylglycerol pyrophosphatase
MNDVSDHFKELLLHIQRANYHACQIQSSQLGSAIPLVSIFDRIENFPTSRNAGVASHAVEKEDFIYIMDAVNQITNRLNECRNELLNLGVHNL